MSYPRLQKLLELVPPPALPTCIGTPEELATIEAGLAKLGYRLPRDVASLSTNYGYGSFFCNNFYLTIHSVFRRHYLQIVEFNHNVYSQAARNFPSEMPWASMFEIGSYEYSSGDQGDTGCIFLNIPGDIDEWRVGLSPPLQQFELSLVDFLIQLVQDEITPQGFPSSFRGAIFIPNHAG